MYVATKRARISDDAAERLRELVEEWGLKPGDRLPPERELAARLGVGRTSVREGLRALELVGFVDVIPSKGVYLKEDAGGRLERRLRAWLTADRGGTRDLIELREALEGQAAALAAARATPVDLATIERQLNAMRAALDDADLEPFVIAEAAFHDAIARASRNGLLRRSLGAIAEEVAAQTLAVAQISADARQRAVAEHAAIVGALRDRDQASASAAMRDHIRNVLTELESDDPGGAS